MPRNLSLKTMAIFIVLLTLVSCSEKDQSNSSAKKESNNLEINGKFKANLSPLNSAVAGMANGKARIIVDRDSIDIAVDIKDAPGFTEHAQFIYNAEKCPGAEDDLNSDGLIDPVEAEKVLGKALIPLDADISAQEIGLTEFPNANGIGQYNYTQNASFSKLVADLRSPDLDPKDDLIKLGRASFSFQHKVIVVHGVESDAYLPATVDAGPGRSVRSSIAIACGKFVKIETDEF